MQNPLMKKGKHLYVIFFLWVASLEVSIPQIICMACFSACCVRCNATALQTYQVCSVGFFFILFRSSFFLNDSLLGDGNCSNFRAFQSIVHYKARCGIIHYFTLTGNCSKFLYQKQKLLQSQVLQALLYRTCQIYKEKKSGK